MYKGRIYEGMLGGTLVVLDQETGKLVWRTTVREKADTVLTGAVRIAKGRIMPRAASLRPTTPIPDQSANRNRELEVIRAPLRNFEAGVARRIPCARARNGDVHARC